VAGSIAKRSEARAALNLPVEPGDDVYLMPMNVIEIGGDVPPPAPEDDEKYEVIVDHHHGSNGELDDPAGVAVALNDHGVSTYDDDLDQDNSY